MQSASSRHEAAILVASLIDVIGPRIERFELKLASVYAADLLGVSDCRVIKAGKRADIIAVAGNPLKDSQVMEDVLFVMQQGDIVKMRDASWMADLAHRGVRMTPGRLW